MSPPIINLGKIILMNPERGDIDIKKQIRKTKKKHRKNDMESKSQDFEIWIDKCTSARARRTERAFAKTFFLLNFVKQKTIICV